MANRRPQGNRRMDFGRNDRGPKNFGRSGVSPWQGGGPGGGMPNLLPLSGGSTEATLALASNIINLLQPRPNPVPSLLDMPIRRDFGPNMGRYDRPFGPNRMGNQGNFRRTGNYNRAGERINTNRKPFRPYEGQRQPNKSPQKKDADSKAKNVKESEEEKPQGENEAGKPEEKKEKESPKTRYDDINPQLLKCHICNKSMWDGRSFENHLSGRAHSIMMQKTAESYALTADTMRQEFKIREMKRSRKTGQQPPRDFYCAMCDLYAADGAIHRTTVGHRKLKKYLHPTCTSCHKEMPTRIELDEHRLTAEHLRNMQDKNDVVSKPKPEVMVISTLNMEQMYLRDDRQRWRSDRKGGAPTAAGDKQEGETEEKEPAEGPTEDKPEEEVAKHPLDKEGTVLDYKDGDDLSNVTPELIPAYSTERGVGRSFLSEFRCVQCTLCRKLLDGEETAEVHLRTWRHHQLFSRLLLDKTGNSASSEGNNAKRAHNPDDEGNWKRRKTTPAGDERENGHGDDREEDRADCDDTAAVKHDEPQSGEPAAKGEDGDCPEDELEDWEQSVDEILQAERDNADDKVSVKEEESWEDDKPLDEESWEDDKPIKEESWEDEKPVTEEQGQAEAKPQSPPKMVPPPVPTPAAQPSPTPAAQSPTPAAQSLTPATPKPKNTPRGRGRGRRRY